MFGYLRLPKSDLDDDQRRLYQGHFCGLCHGLDSWGGKLSSLLTNYDVTFWLLCLTALEESAGRSLQVEERRCTAIPWHQVPVVQLSPSSKTLVAALTMALVGAKVEDDRQDGDRPWVQWAFWPLRGSWQRALPWLEKVGFPCEAVANLPVWQRQLERDGTSLEQMCLPTQHTLQAIFGYLAEHTGQPQLREPLEEIGRGLGLWIYLYDAWNDQVKDHRSGAFNAILRFPTPAAEVSAQMAHALNHVSRGLARLPLGQQRPLLELQVARLRTLARQKLPKPGSSRLACWVAGGLTAAALTPQMSAQCDGCDCPGCDCPGCDCSGCDSCGSCESCGGCDCDACKACDSGDCCECGRCCEGCDDRGKTDCCKDCDCCPDCCICIDCAGGSDQSTAMAKTRKRELEDPTMPGARQKKGRWPWSKPLPKKTDPPPPPPDEDQEEVQSKEGKGE